MDTIMERVFEALRPMIIRKPAKNGAATIRPAHSTNHLNWSALSGNKVNLLEYLQLLTRDSAY
jgi:hypothetical protein